MMSDDETGRTELRMNGFLLLPGLSGRAAQVRADRIVAVHDHPANESCPDRRVVVTVDGIHLVTSAPAEAIGAHWTAAATELRAEPWWHGGAKRPASRRFTNPTIKER